jgi:hypothetical protein
VHRAYIVLTSEALRRVITDLEANPPEAFADLIAEGLAPPTCRPWTSCTTLLTTSPTPATKSGSCLAASR